MGRCAELDAVMLPTGVRLRVPAAEADAAVSFCGLGWMCEIAQISQIPCYVQRPLPSEDGAPAQVAAPLAARVGRDGLLQWFEHLAHRPVSRTHMQPAAHTWAKADMHTCTPLQLFVRAAVSIAYYGAQRVLTA